MFKKNKASSVTPKNTPNTGSKERSEVNTLIGKTTTIKGDLHFTGVLKIDGVIQGNLISDSDDSVLILDDEGRIEGEVHVPNMIVNGSINGNVFASEKIDLYPQAKITGDVHYNLLEMEVGAEVNGRMLRQEAQSFVADQAAIADSSDEAGESIEAS